MTLATQDNRKNYTATGDPATTYSIPFWYNEDETWIEVYVNDVLEPVSSYVVDTVNDTVKFNNGDEPASGKIITLFRAVPPSQLTDYTAFGKFPAESHERALDKATALVQEAKDILKRCLKIGVSVAEPTDLKAGAPAIGKTVKFTDEGSGTFGLEVSEHNPDEAQTDAEASATAAASSASDASDSATAAATSETNAAASASAAASSATDAENAATKAPRNKQTGTTYTLALTDAGEIVEMNNASANTLTVPPNSSVAYPVDTWINVYQYGAGQTTVVAGSGVTIRTPETLKLRKQHAMATLVKRGTDEWHLFGDLEDA